MPVFKREFKRNLKGLLIWTLSITLLMLLMFQQFKATGNNIDTSSYTEAFKKSMGLNKVSMNSFVGYYSIKASILVTLFGSIYAALLSSSMIIKDESLLAKPVTRVKLIFEKLLVVVLNLLVFNAAVTASILLFERNQAILLICLSQLFLHMSFAAMGFLISILKIKSKAALSLPLGIVLATYTFSLIYGLSEKLEVLKYLSPFYYMNSQDIIINSSIGIANLVLLTVVILGCIISGGLIYHRKDLPS